MSRQRREIVASPADVTRGRRFAQWLRLQRAKRGWTKTELSERSGVSPSYLSLFENGCIKPDGKFVQASDEILERLASAFGVERREVQAAAGQEVPELEYVPDIDVLLSRVEGFSDFDGTERYVIREAALQAAKNMALSLRKLNSRGTVGARFTEEEISAEEEEQERLSRELDVPIGDVFPNWNKPPDVGEES